MSTLLDTVNDYMRRLMAGESQAEATLNAFHVQTLAAIQPALDRLYKQMTDALADGEQLSVSWLMEAGRLEIIKKLISGQIDQFGALALATTGRIQQGSVLLGQDAALAMLRSTLPPGISWSFGIPSLKAISRLVGATQAGSPLAKLFNGFGAEAARKASQALVTGVTTGQNPRAVASEVANQCSISRDRALICLRQEMLRCYKGAATETYRANDDVMDQWRWMCAKQGRTCIACLMMDGTLHDLSEDLESHVQCRCTPIPITKPWGEILGRPDLPDARPHIETGADWFARQGENIQRQVLGNAKYDAWKAGKFALPSIVKHSHDKDWGRSIGEKPLRELVGAKK